MLCNDFREKQRFLTQLNLSIGSLYHESLYTPTPIMCVNILLTVLMPDGMHRPKQLSESLSFYFPDFFHKDGTI